MARLLTTAAVFAALVGVASLVACGGDGKPQPLTKQEAEDLIAHDASSTTTSCGAVDVEGYPAITEGIQVWRCNLGGKQGCWETGFESDGTPFARAPRVNGLIGEEIPICPEYKDTEASPSAVPLNTEQGCVDLWNEPGNSGPQLALHALTPGRYVSVGFASDYPDRCLITASNPDKGGAMQFLETRRRGEGWGGGNFRIIGGKLTVPIWSLDPSVTTWNARAISLGTALSGIELR